MAWKKISRDGAIRLIYAKASEITGETGKELYKALHEQLVAWGYGKKPKLTKMPNAKLRQVLINLGVEEEIFVTSNPQCTPQQDNELNKRINRLLELGWTEYRIKKLLLKKYGVIHHRALKQKQRRGLFDMLDNYIEQGEKQNEARF